MRLVWACDSHLRGCRLPIRAEGFEVLAVDQSSANNRQLVGGARQVWAADVPGGANRYVALFNRDATAGNVALNLSTLAWARPR